MYSIEFSNFEWGPRPPQAPTWVRPWVGPRGAGKSTLVNRITRVFDKDDDHFAPERAQVSCKSYQFAHTILICELQLIFLLMVKLLDNSELTGTCFVREYQIPRNSNGICIYDTRSLSRNPEKDMKILQRWMTNGISHGEMVMW
jgi:ABC-type branched-subunit amino acid transport system ATPase component